MTDRRHTPLNNFTRDNTLLSDRISGDFTVRELVKSDIATRRMIDNRFYSDEQLRSAINLCRQILQPIRDNFGPFTPNSVYRSQATERALKGKPPSWTSKSQHTKGEAADIEVGGLTTLGLAEWIRNNIPSYDQIICEMYDPKLGPNSGWVHVSLKRHGTAPNRKQLLSYIRGPAGYHYVNGLV